MPDKPLPKSELSIQAAQNLLIWAELTALAIELRKAFLVGVRQCEDADHAVWAEFTLNKEKAWTTNPS